MTQYVVYFYDDSGLITSVNRADRSADDPFLKGKDRLAMADYIKAKMTTEHPDRPIETVDVHVHGGGWSFVLGKDGNPQKDNSGNYILTPPPFVITPPTVADYAVFGLIKSGALNPAKDLHPHYVTGLNRTLASFGLSTIPGIDPLPLPTRSCKLLG